MIEIQLSAILKAIYLGLAATLLFKVSQWIFHYVNKLITVNKIKGLPTIPIIGNLHYVKSRKHWLNQLAFYSHQFKDEPIWRLWLGKQTPDCYHLYRFFNEFSQGWTPMFIFHRAEALDILLSNQKVITKSYEYTFMEPWLRTGLLTSNGEKWHARRRLITPAFHFEILEDFLHIMNEQSEILTEKLTKMVKAQEEIDLFKILQLCTLDVISETAMGQNVNAQNDQDSEYVKAVTNISEVILARMVNPFLWPDFMFYLTPHARQQKRCLDVLHKFTRQVIMQRDADFEANDFAMNKRAAFLDIMLKAKHDDPTITFDDIQEEVDTFMFEGNDSTAAAASWACHLIGWHPEVQKKLHEEVDKVFGNTNRPMTKEDLKKLDYLECVIKETLRLFPSVPFFGRLMTDDVDVGPYKITKGDTAMVVIYAVHRDEKYFPDPEKFDPDRFLPENCKDRHPFAYIPFAAGRRNCIGQRFAQMEEKVLLANLLRTFEIKSLRTTEELNPMAEIVTRPFSGMPVELKLRH